MPRSCAPVARRRCEADRQAPRDRDRLERRRRPPGEGALDSSLTITNTIVPKFDIGALKPALPKLEDELTQWDPQDLNANPPNRLDAKV